MIIINNFFDYVIKNMKWSILELLKTLFVHSLINAVPVSLRKEVHIALIFPLERKKSNNFFIIVKY